MITKALLPVGLVIQLNFTQCSCFQNPPSGLSRGYSPTSLVEANPSNSRVLHGTKNGDTFVALMTGKDEEGAKGHDSETILGVFKKNPGTIIALPFVIL